jgi:hypothetical protein
MLRKSLLIILVIPLVSILIACGSSSDSDAYVRVIHGSADAPAVDVLVDDAAAIAELIFGDFAGYVRVEAGDRNFKVNAAGTDTVVINADASLEEDKFYTVIASGPLASISPLVLVDNVEGAEGMSMVRVVHNAASAPAVDVYATAPGADLSTATPVLTGVPFQAVSDYLSVPAGTYQFRVTVAGTTTVAIDTGAVELASGTNYTAIALDAVGGGAPFQALLLVDQKA